MDKIKNDKIRKAGLIPIFKVLEKSQNCGCNK